MFECRNCEAHRAEPFYAGVPDRFHGYPGAFNYVRCAGCALVQLEEIPADLGAYYGDYRVHGRESALYRLLRRMTIGHSYHQPPGRGRAMLDYGAGSGWYLKAMADAGWRATGYELDPAHAARLSERVGLPVLSGDALDAYPAAFDLITLNFVFEHLEQPRRVLDRLTRCLKPGGELYLSVPNIEGREARLFKEHWFHLDPPRHVTFFTKPQLSGLLRDAGYDDIAIKDLAVPTGFAGSVAYRLWDRFERLTWYGAVVPGLVFSRVIRDGNFAVTARLKG
ncbi:MAG TPA: class I SAM-dependent methyltransferase [Kofleriaceae bacterium]|jgi:SAM-dependent methyltransferase|nr:class I SAM-dependent methyltransferase [Kofleriaceae bacterium]